MLAAALPAVLLAFPGTAPAADEFDERAGNVFFSRPDRETSKRMDELINRFAHGSVPDRSRSRKALTEIGFWAVEPLIEALEESKSTVRYASVLTLESIADPRAVEPLRNVARSDTDWYVSGFAALALGRFRDGESVPAFQRALASPKSLTVLRTAVPFALARIRGEAARADLMSQIKTGRGNEQVTAARLIALGFFPQDALEVGTARPGPVLRRGFKSKKRGVAEAAMVGYLVATVRRRDTRSLLLELAKKEDDFEVLLPILIGLARYEDAEVTEFLATTASGRGTSFVRSRAARLLVDRGDPVALPHLARILRGSNPSGLRGAALLALSSIDHENTPTLVIQRLADQETFVRGCAAIAATRISDPAARKTAHGIIDRRLRDRGESDVSVRRVMRLARSSLGGSSALVRWNEVLRHPIFERIGWSNEQWLLAEVNLFVERAMDLGKVTNLQADGEIDTGLGPRFSTDSASGEAGESGSEGGTDGGGEGEGGSEDLGDSRTEPGEGTQVPSFPNAGLPNLNAPSRGSAPAPGGPRTNVWQELRDLKIRLREAPYFGREDLPPSELVPTFR